MMKQQFLFVAFALVMLYDATSAQIMPCGPFKPVIADNSTYNCTIMHGGECNKVMLVVTGFAHASGYGASVVSSLVQKGEYVSCYIYTKSTSAVLVCQEFYKINKMKHAERFEMELGHPMHIDSVMIAITKRFVKVTVNVHTRVVPGKTQSSKHHTMKEKTPYAIDGIFPIREQTGFCSQQKIYYSANSLAFYKKNRSKERVNRKGFGYFASVYMSPY